VVGDKKVETFGPVDDLVSHLMTDPDRIGDRVLVA